VEGRFDQRIFFGHKEAGEYTLEVWFFPIEGPGQTSIRYHTIKVAQDSGPIEVPVAYYHSLIDKARFEPNAMRADDKFMPPLYVRTGGQVRRVTAFVTSAGEEKAYELRDDGAEGDAVSGDGVYTHAAIPLVPDELALGDFGNLRSGVQIIYADGTINWQVAECGIVAGARLSEPTRLSANVYRSDHVLNLVDQGDLFRASGRVPSGVMGHGFSNEYGLDFAQVSALFYEHLPDEFDFLVIRSAHSLINGVHGVNIGVKNEVAGIGLEPFDNAEHWSSGGRLRSALFINFGLVGPLVHELAHNWSTFLALFNSNFWGGHWGLSDVGGVLGGNAEAFEQLEEGVYAVNTDATNSFWGGRYSNL